MGWHVLLPLLATATAPQAWGAAAARAAVSRVGVPLRPAQRPAAGFGGGGGGGGGGGRGGSGGDDWDGTREVRFVPSFRAAHVVEGVVHAPRSGDESAAPWDALSDDTSGPQALYSRYNVSARSSLRVVSQLAQGLTRTGQLGAASALVRAYLEFRPPGEAAAAAPLPATAVSGGAADPAAGARALPRGTSGDLAEHDDVRLANLVLDACAHHGQMASCDSILDALHRCRLSPSAYTYCILIKGYGRARDVARVSAVLDAMAARGLPADVATHNAVIDAYCRNRRMGLAEAALARMEAQRVEPTTRTYNTLLRGYADLGPALAEPGRRGGASSAQRAWQRVPSPVPPGPSSQPASSQPAAGYLSSRGRSSLHLAFGVLRRMRARLGGHAPDGVTYNTLVSACVRARRVGRARAMLRALAAAEAVRPRVGAEAQDRAKVGGSAAARGEGMPARGGGAGAIPVGGAVGRPRRPPPSRPAPDVIAYTSVMRGMLSEAKPLQEVLALLVEMRRARIAPNSVTATTLLTGCFERGNATAARAVATYLERIADEIQTADEALHGVDTGGGGPAAAPGTSASRSAPSGAAGLGSGGGGDGAGACAAARLRHDVSCAMLVGLCQPVRLPVAAFAGYTEGAGRPAARDRALVLEAARRFFSLCGAATDEGPGSAWGGSARRADPVAEGRGWSQVPVRTCNALLSALVSMGELTLASRSLALMDSSPSAASPNAYSLSILLAAHGRAAQLRPAAVLWGRLRAGGWVDGVALNSWIGACANNGQLRLALQAFQEAKAVPALNRTLDLVTFATLIRPLVDTRTEAGATRALRLWAEMHARGIAADGALVGTMITACERTPSLGAEVALRIRLQLHRLGWSPAQLAPFHARIEAMLPPVSQIMAQENRWAVLGVRLPSVLHSEAPVLDAYLPPPPPWPHSPPTARQARAMSAQTLGRPPTPETQPSKRPSQKELPSQRRIDPPSEQPGGRRPDSAAGGVGGRSIAPGARVAAGPRSDGQGGAGDTGGENVAVEEEVGGGGSGRRRQPISGRGGGPLGEIDPEAGFEKASASEEIFELKGWNKMDGSWRAL